MTTMNYNYLITPPFGAYTHLLWDTAVTHRHREVGRVMSLSQNIKAQWSETAGDQDAVTDAILATSTAQGRAVSSVNPCAIQKAARETESRLEISLELGKTMKEEKFQTKTVELKRFNRTC